MHDAMTSIRSIRCVANTKKRHLQHNGIIGFLMKLGHTWPILTLAHKTVKWNQRHVFQTREMFSPWIKHDTKASMKTKYGMATYTTCPPS